MEYGLGDAIPLYAGGLGVLAGDHLEAASDLGVPMVAVGLLYQEGYFRQLVDAAGRQEELYPYNDPTALPIQPTPAPSGGWLKIPVDLPGRKLWLRVWQAMVGRVPLYLLDANVPINEPADRGITGKLYGDGPEMRLRQEIALGIGGWRLLDTLGIEPGACHLNEGHTAFVVLERARAAMQAHDLPFGAALAATRAGNLFTTHTSVAAGFDAFPAPLMAKYFPPGRGLLAELGLSLHDLMALGRAPGADAGEPFRPAYLAIRGAARVNAVSALHAETSKALFAPLFPRWPLAEVPITHVTNGVHVPSWDSSFTDELWTAACGPDRWRGSTEGHAESIASVDDRKLWTVRGQARRQLVEQVRVRLGRQLARRGAGPETIAEAGRALDPDVLTLGIARRFAEYKRNNLLLSDEPRLRRLLTDARRPVQIVVAGKAHPDDLPSKAMVQAWVRFAADARDPRALRLRRGLRPHARARAGSGRRRLDQHAPPPLGSVWDQRHEGPRQRRPQPLRSRRLVGGGVHARGRMGHQRHAGFARRRCARRRRAVPDPRGSGDARVLRSRRGGRSPPVARACARQPRPAHPAVFGQPHAG